MELDTKVLLILVTYFSRILDAIIYNTEEIPKPYNYYNDNQQQLDMVILTQKGYIQFLKYIKDVPAMTEYTFCIWMRSHNLTYSHPILSYSKHEEERLIRVWITPKGKNISVEILNNLVGSVPIHIEENKWYHFCQSWTSYEGKWSIFLNRELISYGFAPQLKGSFIKNGGDIVVGQEYTDFDKGLDDGIEGDIFGFNFVLSSASSLLQSHLNTRRHRKYKVPNQTPHLVRTVIPYQRPRQIIYRPIYVRTSRIDQNVDSLSTVPDLEETNNCITEPNYHQDTQDVQISTTTNENTQRRQFLDNDRYRLISPPSVNYLDDEHGKPLGLKLVELSFDCSFKKGAPLNGKDVLINWRTSPVRVFGGAVMKLISPSFCKV